MNAVPERRTSRTLATLSALAGLATGTDVWAQSPTPQAPPPAFALSAPDLSVSSDSEGFTARKLGASLYPWYAHGDRHTGLQVQHNAYSRAGWRMQGESVSVVHRAVDPRTAMGYQVRAGIDRINGQDLLTLDGSHSVALTAQTTAEFVINRDRVETQDGLQDGLHLTSAGAGLWQQVNDRLNVGGLVQVMRFSDSNTRHQVRLRLVYDLLPEHGVTLQLRYRGYRASNTEVPRRYFNPAEFEEGMVAVGVRRRIAGWVVAGTLGVGRQQVAQDTPTPTQLAQLSVTSPLAGPVFWRARLGYSRSSGLQGPDYRYRYVTQELFVPF